MLTSPRFIPLGIGCLAALGWGLTGTFIKLLPQFSTLEVLCLRVAIAGLAMVPLLAMNRALRADLPRLLKPRTLLLSSLMVLYYLCAVRAFQLAPVSDVTLVVGLSPLLGLLAKAGLRQPLVPSEIGGGITAFSGLVLFVLPKLQGTGGQGATYLVGLGFALLAAAVTLTYASLFKAYGASQPQLTPLAVALMTFTLGSGVLVPLALVSSPQLVANLLQPQVGGMVLGLGVLSTGVPTLCYSYAAKHLSPILTTALNLVTPVFAAITAAILLGEYLTSWSIFGALLILVGILILSWPSPRPSQAS